jgi:hypothetical protein
LCLLFRPFLFFPTFLTLIDISGLTTRNLRIQVSSILLLQLLLVLKLARGSTFYDPHARGT